MPQGREGSLSPGQEGGDLPAGGLGDTAAATSQRLVLQVGAGAGWASPASLLPAQIFPKGMAHSRYSARGWDRVVNVIERYLPTWGVPGQTDSKPVTNH